MRMPTLVLTFLVVTGLSPASIVLAQPPTVTPSEALRPPAAIAGAVASPDAASADGATFGALFSELGQELRRLPSRSTALTLGLGGALALATFPADRRLTERATQSMPLDPVFEVGEHAEAAGYRAAAAARSAQLRHVEVIERFTTARLGHRTSVTNLPGRRP